jgi:general secretion pathway protein D
MIQRLSCQFACLVVLLALTLPLKAEEGHVLNFKDADIRSLITAVAEMTGKNFIIDPQVTGRVTVMSTQPLAADEVYDVFLSILRVHGYTAVADDRVVRILPDVNARQDGRVPIDDMRGGGDEPVTRIFCNWSMCAPPKPRSFCAT